MTEEAEAVKPMTLEEIFQLQEVNIQVQNSCWQEFQRKQVKGLERMYQGFLQALSQQSSHQGRLDAGNFDDLKQKAKCLSFDYSLTHEAKKFVSYIRSQQKDGQLTVRLRRYSCFSSKKFEIRWKLAPMTEAKQTSGDRFKKNLAKFKRLWKTQGQPPHRFRA